MTKRGLQHAPKAWRHGNCSGVNMVAYRGCTQTLPVLSLLKAKHMALQINLT